MLVIVVVSRQVAVTLNEVVFVSQPAMRGISEPAVTSLVVGEIMTVSSGISSTEAATLRGMVRTSLYV